MVMMTTLEYIGRNYRTATLTELAEKLHMDPVVLREKNMTKEGGRFIGYDGGTEVTSCALDRCMARAKEMFHWDEKPLARDMGNGKIRAKGVAMAMQGSGISGVDVGISHTEVK